MHGQAFVELWLQTPDGPVKIISDAQLFVFFVSQDDLNSTIAALSQSDLAFSTKSLSLKTFTHQSVAGVYFKSGFHFYRAREKLRLAGITIYEDDIRLVDRFLMERFVYGSATFAGLARTSRTHNYAEYTDCKIKPAQYKPNLSMLSLDIECSAQGELFSIGLANETDKWVLMIGQPQESGDWIKWVADEQALLEALVDQIQTIDPDVIVGWNVVNFDFRLLIARAAVYKVALLFGRDGSELTWRDARGESNQGFVTIAGRVLVDGIDAMKTATYQFDSFALQDVSIALLGRGKKADDVANRLDEIQYNFEHQKIKLAEYNIEDCILVLEIFKHTKLLDYLMLRSQLTGLELDRMGGSVAAFINLYLPKLHRAGYVSPNRPAGGGLASPGGYVMDSVPGLYKHVLVLDFKSLYPSIIRTFKIDPLGLVEGLQAPKHAIPGFKQAVFSRTKHFLPAIIEELWLQRDQAKQQNDSARSQAIKIIMNSFYGVLGSGGCPFYDTRLASSITLRGHQIMQDTAKWIEDRGYKVIYGDTDSTFVWLQDCTSNQDALSIGKQLETGINQLWQNKLRNEFELDCHLEIEFETLFEQFVMPTIRGSEAGSKKRYAGLKHTGDNTPEIIFKGLENVRSDWTLLAKEFQYELYRRVFAEQEIANFIQNLLTQIRQGDHDEKLVYRKRLRQKLSQYTKNVPPHVRAARIADEENRKLGKPLAYQNKGWISYVITVEGPRPVEYITFALDYEHYIDKQIRPVAEAILPFIGQSFEQITSAQLGLF